MKYFNLVIILMVIVSCQPTNDTNEKLANSEITEEGFQNLMKNISEGWSTQNTDLALSSFDEDAIYMEPPSIQYFRGHKQLRPYFDELTEVHRMKFHSLWFNPKTQSGTGEFTFSYGRDSSTVGVVVVELQNGKIKFWREYQQYGPTNFEDFIGTENKDWEWHIGNYPEPKDAMNTKQTKMKHKKEHLNPDGLLKNPAFSQIVTTQGKGRTIYIGGQNAVNANQEIVGKNDIALQTEQVMKNLEIALKACGATFENLVKLNINVMQGQDVTKGFQVSQKFLGQSPTPPVVTVLFVAGFANPHFLIEIDAIAFTSEQYSSK